MPNQYHSSSTPDLLNALQSSNSGLAQLEAANRLQIDGLNKISESQKTNWLLVFLKQFHNGLVYILLAAAGISFFFNHPTDGIVILAVVFFNAVLGFVQEYKAHQSMQALRQMVVSTSKVYRDKTLQNLASEQLVVGDVIELEEGDKIPADCRLLDVKNLSCNESSLTGESVAVSKSVDTLAQNTALVDQNNMIWMGTYTTSGRAKAVVVATGDKTRFGQIAASLQSIDKKKSHFDQKSETLARQLALVAVCSSLLIFLIGFFWRKENIFDLFLLTLASLVSAVPEGLPAVLAVTLSVGANRMSKHKAIIRNLSATETLGVVTTICTDKTGTLTQNVMTVKNVWLSDESEYNILEKDLLIIKKDNSEKINLENVKDSPNLFYLYQVLLVCLFGNKATATKNKNGTLEVLGDPTEAALVMAAQKANLYREKMTDYKLLDEIPFSSSQKMRASLISLPTGERFIYVTGAGEEVIKKSILDDAKKQKIQDKISFYAALAMRTLGLAIKKVSLTQDRIELEDLQDLEFLGVVAMEDPVRPEAKDALHKARQAGIRVMMLTGDHKATAIAIGKQIDLIEQDADINLQPNLALTDSDIKNLDDKELSEVLKTTSIFARLNPETKMRITKLLQEQGEVVAMTGDGVNDAPALKQADIGISMGQNGTDVARECSQIVLADNNFASIVKAIEEGRIVFENVRKNTYYLISTNLAEIVTIIFCIIFGFALPITASQILWLNLVTDGITAIALAFDPGSKNILLAKPKKISQNILNKKVVPLMILMVSVMVPLTIFTFLFFESEGLEKARTAAFLVMSMSQIFNIPNLRSLTQSAFSENIFKNQFLNWAWLFTFLLIVFGPVLPIASFLKFVPLNVSETAILVLLSSLVLWVMEIYKFLKRKLSVKTVG